MYIIIIINNILTQIKVIAEIKINIGENELDLLEGYSIGIIDYSGEYLEGSGIAILYNENKKKWAKFNLGHCSCHGPFETLSGGISSGTGDLEESCTGLFTTEEINIIVEKDGLDSRISDFVNFYESLQK